MISDETQREVELVSSSHTHGLRCLWIQPPATVSFLIRIVRHTAAGIHAACRVPIKRTAWLLNKNMHSRNNRHGMRCYRQIRTLRCNLVLRITICIAFYKPTVLTVVLMLQCCVCRRLIVVSVSVFYSVAFSCIVVVQPIGCNTIKRSFRFVRLWRYVLLLNGAS